MYAQVLVAGADSTEVCNVYESAVAMRSSSTESGARATNAMTISKTSVNMTTEFELFATKPMRKLMINITANLVLKALKFLLVLLVLKVHH